MEWIYSDNMFFAATKEPILCIYVLCIYVLLLFLCFCCISPGAIDRNNYLIYHKKFHPMKMLVRYSKSKIKMSATPTWGRLGLTVAQMPQFGGIILPN